MCTSSPKMPPPAPERQALKTPDGASSGGIADDVAKRRRALAMAATTMGGLGNASGPSVTTVLGG